MEGKIAIGTCDGTGAAINVCCGFTPRFVALLNPDDAGSIFGLALWWKMFSLHTDWDEGVLLDVATPDVTRMTTGGISAYAGGDTIVYDGATDNRWENTAGTNVEESFVNGHYIRTATTDPAYQCVGDSLCGSSPQDGQRLTTPEGFTIGTNADLNQDGEQLFWVAIA